MLNRAFLPHNRLFACALLALVLNLACSLGLGLLVGGRAWQAQAAYRQEMADIKNQSKLWQAQGRGSYTLLYTQCATYGTCCQAAPVEVVGNTIPILPTCASNMSTVSYPPNAWDGPQYKLLTMQQTYAWLAAWREEYPQHYLEISYHPEQHYITRLEYEPYEGSQHVVIEYQIIGND